MGLNLDARLRKIEKSKPAQLVRIEPLSPEVMQFMRTEGREATHEVYDHVRASGGDFRTALDAEWKALHRLAEKVLGEGIEGARAEIERLRQERPPIAPDPKEDRPWDTT